MFALPFYDVPILLFVIYSTTFHLLSFIFVWRTCLPSNIAMDEIVLVSFVWPASPDLHGSVSKLRQSAAVGSTRQPSDAKACALTLTIPLASRRGLDLHSSVMWFGR